MYFNSFIFFLLNIVLDTISHDEFKTSRCHNSIRISNLHVLSEYILNMGAFTHCTKKTREASGIGVSSVSLTILQLTGYSNKSSRGLACIGNRWRV